jgi:WD40 repeat protein
MDPVVIMRDQKCDFRDVIIDDDGVIYALSRNGMLLTKSDKGILLTQLEGSNFMRIIKTGSNSLMLVSDYSLAYYDKSNMKLIKTVPLSDKVSSVGEKDGACLLFCQDDKAYTVGSDGTIKALPLTVGSPVTAYAWSPALSMSALGTNSGKIFIYDASWNNVKTLIGHRSAITQVGFNKNSLFSSSYDCTVDLWNMKMQKVEPITLRTSKTWIHCFNASENGVIWTGDESGNLSRILISPFDMANKIKDELTRDMTSDEWNYYIGSSIPFESYKKH